MFERLDSQAAAKVITALMRCRWATRRTSGGFSGIGEYKIDWGPGYRVYLAKEAAALIILFTGGTKHRQDADIDRALTLYQEFKARKAGQKAAHLPPRRRRGSKRS